MKAKLFVTAILLCVGFAGIKAQHGTPMSSLSEQEQHDIIFAFPGCTDGTVYMRNGEVFQGKLNYNFFEPQVLFLNDKPQFDGDTLRRLDNLSQVFLIEIGDRSFVPVLNGTGLGELILNNKVSLVQCKKVNISEKKTGAYGTGGSTSSIQNVSTFSGVNGTTSSGTYTGQTTTATVKYEFSSSSILSIEYTLFLLKDGKTVPLTKKNLLKLFPKAANFITQYLADNKPDLDNPQDMLTLVNLANANNK